MEVSFTILGQPVAKARPRVCKWGTYTPQKTVNYETLVKLCYSEQVGDKGLLQGALRMTIVAYMSIPKRSSKANRLKMISGEIRPTPRPDLDNIQKIVSDALNEIAYKDDSYIVETFSGKWYSERPRLEVSIEEIF